MVISRKYPNKISSPNPWQSPTVALFLWGIFLERVVSKGSLWTKPLVALSEFPRRGKKYGPLLLKEIRQTTWDVESSCKYWNKTNFANWLFGFLNHQQNSSQKPRRDSCAKKSCQSMVGGFVFQGWSVEILCLHRPEKVNHQPGSPFIQMSWLKSNIYWISYMKSKWLYLYLHPFVHLYYMHPK